MKKKFELFDEIYMVEWNSIVKVLWCNWSSLGCTWNEKDDIDIVTKNFDIKNKWIWYCMNEKDIIRCSKDKLFANKNDAITLLWYTL